MTSVDLGLYSRIVGAANSRIAVPAPAAAALWPGGCCPPPRRARRAAARPARPQRARAKSFQHGIPDQKIAASRKPNSVRLSPCLAHLAMLDAGFGVTIIHLAPPLLAGSSDRPGDSLDGPSSRRRHANAPAPGASLFGLAPCGVLPATDVTTGAVRSYRTFSPLPLLRSLSLSVQRATEGKPLCGLPTVARSAKVGRMFSVPLSFRSP